MLDPTQQARFQRSCNDAMFGYASAAMTAYGSMLDQAMSFWPGSTSAPKSYERPSLSPPTFTALGPFAATDPAAQMWQAAVFGWMDPSRWGPAPVASPLFALNPWAAWWQMFASPRAATATPMAFCMMSAGVPRAVAWPTAEANAAALEAAEIATQSLNEAFSSYRSGGGHVSAQISSPSALLNALMLLPFGAAAFMPWAAFTPGSSY